MTRTEWGWGIAGVVALWIVGAFIGHNGHNVPNQSMDKDGVYYQVKPGDEGNYVTAGPSHGNRFEDTCQWAHLSPTFDLSKYTEIDALDETVPGFINGGEVTDGHNGYVTLRVGEYFRSYGCRPWWRES